MWNWFKKRRNPMNEVLHDAVPVSTLIRWYLYDLDVKEANKIAAMFNLMPVSFEGDEKERQDAKKRMAQIESLIPYVYAMSEINASAVFAVQREEILKTGLTEEQLNEQEDSIRSFYENMSFAAISSALSIATHLGLIQVSGMFTSIGGTNE